eukprot:1333970-Karenia_brevis.AAC.1
MWTLVLGPLGSGAGGGDALATPGMVQYFDDDDDYMITSGAEDKQKKNRRQSTHFAARGTVPGGTFRRLR